MSPSRALTGGAVLVLLAGTAACGLESVSPQVELRDAVVAFAEARSTSFTVSVPSSPADVRAFLAATGEDDSSVDDALLEDLLGIELVVAYDRGEDGKSAADDAGVFQLRVDGEAYGEVRTVDEVLYVRVDVSRLSDRFPDMTEGVDALRAEMEATDLGPLGPAAEAALAGEWVSVDAGGGSWLAEQRETMPGAPMQLPDDFGQRLLDLAGKALDASVSVREVDDRLIATANTRDLYTEVAADLPELLGEIAPGVEDGELERVEVDVAQFLDEPTGHFVIRLDTADEGPSIEAPGDAVELDLEELAAMSGATPDQLLGGFVGAGGGSEVEAVALAVGDEFRMYAEHEGVAPSVEHLPVIAEYFAGMLELQAVGDRVQVTYDGEVACLTLAPDTMTDSTATPGPC